MQAVLECKQCGAQLEVEENQKIVKCKFCGSSNAVSFIDRMGLYNRANYLRRQNEFDRAISVYEDILKEDAHDAEAYYGIALCKYGIEYVDDPNGNGKMPTCHRTRYTPISQDIDFKKAIENADNDTAMLYAEEAGKIDRILLKIQALSNKHEKYDVFICYKEGDGMGGRTQTSVFAQDIYQELVRQEYKVFFARKTLETKLGSDYEPIIFAALFSAKVMLVVGTKPEEFQGVWVRNEWTRYRERMANGEACTLIPLYRDMSPYELPQEFVNLQALDMGKIGFMQDLSDGLTKLIRKDANVSMSKANVVDDISNVNLKKRARLELEQGNFSGAATYIERALDKEPEDAESYIMKVQISRKCRSEEELGEGLDSLEADNNYQLALRFALPDALERYKGYEELIRHRLLEIEKAEEAARIRKEKEDEEYRKRLEEEKERKKLENERKRQEAKARNKILRKKALKGSIVAVIIALCLPILCFICARVMQGIYLKTENVCGLYNVRYIVEEFLRETGIYYEIIVTPNGYNNIYLNTDFFMGNVDGQLHDEILEKNITEADWENLNIEEHYSNGFVFGVTQDGELCYRWYGEESDIYISERATYYTLRDLKKELDKKGKIKQFVVMSWDYLYCVMENGDVEFAILNPTWHDFDSKYICYKKIEDSRYEIPKWKEVDRIRFMGEYILAIKNNGDIVYHNCEPDYYPELVNLDEIDFDTITYWELIDNYAVGTPNVEYAVPVEE